MGKAGRNELRKMGGQYLNGVAVAMLAAGAIAPGFGDGLSPLAMVVVVTCSVALHFLARAAVSGVED